MVKLQPNRRHGIQVEKLHCFACHYKELVALPVPHPARAVISDGRAFPRTLQKVACPACGLVSHAQPPGPGIVRQFYSESFDLGLASGKAEHQRAEVYARVIADATSTVRPLRVLEVGCGGGLVLERLATQWPEAIFVGLEAAPALARRTTSERITIYHSYVEDLPAGGTAFDLVFAINVLEHAQDPRRFLSAVARQIDPSGIFMLICPASEPPNLELLFLDHIHTFTEASLAMLAQASGMRLCGRVQPKLPVGDFGIFILQRADTWRENETLAHDRAANAALATLRENYLSNWAGLEAKLAAQISPETTLAAFGAGEAAALLRAYAPKIWDRIEFLVVDQTQAARRLDKPVRLYPNALVGTNALLLLAVHPRGQNSLAARLREDGCNVIAWNDLIPC
jgi:SAM-dependent methyltransferase